VLWVKEKVSVKKAMQKKEHKVSKKTSMSPWRPFFEENTSTKAKQLGLVQNAASIPGGLDFEAG